MPFLVVAFVVVMLTGGAVVHTMTQQRDREVARLQAIADLKARQIADWLEERAWDAEFIGSSNHYAELYRRWRETGDGIAGEMLQERLKRFQSSRSFRMFQVLDPTGQPVWSSAPEETPQELAPELRTAVAAAIADHQVHRAGPYRDAAGVWHLDLVVSLAAEPAPLIVLHIDPADWLYPTLQTWPVPSATGETLLFRRDGNDVLFLNELRHRQDTAAKLRIPLTDRELLAAQLLRGQAHDGSVIEGRDYRDVPVLGVARGIAGTNWSMIAKVDLADLNAEAAKDATGIALAGLLALFLAGAGIYLLRQRAQLAISANTSQSQAERLRTLELLSESEGRFRALVEQSAAGIYIVQDNRFRYVNPYFAKLAGYASAQEVMDNVRFIDLVAPEHRALIAEKMQSSPGRRCQRQSLQHHRAAARRHPHRSRNPWQCRAIRESTGGHRPVHRHLRPQGRRGGVACPQRRTGGDPRCLDGVRGDLPSAGGERHRLDFLAEGGRQLQVCVAGLPADFRLSAGRLSGRREPDDDAWCIRMIAPSIWPIWPWASMPISTIYNSAWCTGTATVRWIEHHCQPIRGDNGENLGRRGTNRDITARKAAELQLRKLAQAVEQSPESISITDVDGNLEYVNEAFVRTTGYGRDEVLGRNPRILQSGQDAAGDLRRIVGRVDQRPVLEGRVLQPGEGRQRIRRVRHHHADAPGGRTIQPLCGGQGGHHREEAHRPGTRPPPPSPGRAGGQPHRRS